MGDGETMEAISKFPPVQGRFVNDLGELHRIQLAIGQLESDQRHDQLAQVR